jgi:hypothetical protein
MCLRASTQDVPVHKNQMLVQLIRSGAGPDCNA